MTDSVSSPGWTRSQGGETSVLSSGLFASVWEAVDTDATSSVLHLLGSAPQAQAFSRFYVGGRPSVQRRVWIGEEGSGGQRGASSQLCHAVPAVLPGTPCSTRTAPWPSSRASR